MQLPKWFTIPWWILLFLAFSILGATRVDEFIAGQATNPDVVLLIVWLALALAPIFHEVNVFGLKLKQQIETMQKDISGQFTALQTQITASFRTEISPHINLGLGVRPASELAEPLKKLKAEYGDRGARPAAAEQGSQEPLVISPDQIEVPKEVSFLFAVRFSIEKELRKIWALKMPETSPSHPTWSEMLNGLVDDQVLARRAAYQISNVIRITAWGIHGETLTESHRQYVRDAAPFLISLLRHTD